MHENAPIPKWHMALILAAGVLFCGLMVNSCEKQRDSIRPVYVHLRQEIQ